MEWAILAIFGAFAQAFGSAIKKKSLQTLGMNNVIGFVSFTVAGLLFGVFMFATGSSWPEHISSAFIRAMFWYAGLNIIAVWFLYKALDSAEFNYLMPFMTLTSLSMIVPPMIVLNEIPSSGSFVGIALIVIGALWINYRPKEEVVNVEDERRKRANRRGLWYFLATAACYTVAPTVQKITVQETSVLFASLVVHLLIGLGFLIIVFIAGEYKKISVIAKEKKFSRLRSGLLLLGLIVVIENGSINAALGMAPVASVMAIKRLMPFFAFLIGYFYFKERSDVRKKLLATVLLVTGAILVTVL